MSHQLESYVFTEADYDKVQGFDCGEEDYKREVSDWLKGPKNLGHNSALGTITDPKAPNRVWLYRNQEERLVGFGAIGRSEWRWTKGKDPWVPVSLIIWCGIHVEFQNDRCEPKEMRYSNQIVEDLIAAAAEDSEQFPVLGLCVAQDNSKATKLYKRFKFFEEGLGTYTDSATNRTYQKMALILDQRSLREYLDQKKLRRGWLETMTQ